MGAGEKTRGSQPRARDRIGKFAVGLRKIKVGLGSLGSLGTNIITMAMGARALPPGAGTRMGGTGVLGN